MSRLEANEKAVAYGGVVVNAGGKVLLRKPAGEYDGYVWTFAKGRPKPAQTPQQAALCEVLEETGWECEGIEPIPGTFAGGTTSTAYFLMKSLRDTGALDYETAEVIWVSLEEAHQPIEETRNEVGRKRDLCVLRAAVTRRPQYFV